LLILLGGMRRVFTGEAEGLNFHVPMGELGCEGGRLAFSKCKHMSTNARQEWLSASEVPLYLLYSSLLTNRG
jgi:hypothetical protein